MIEFEEGQPQYNQERLQGEIIGTLAQLNEEYETQNLELAFAVLRGLNDYIYKHAEPTEVAAYLREAGEILLHQAEAVESVLQEDFKRKLN
ncbi:hypothetical protein NBRC116602_07030 [Hyphomicrobiales bacterium 4NK60-0047b]